MLSETPGRDPRWPHVTDILRDAGVVDTAWVTQDAMDRGSAVHLATQLLEENDLDEETIDPQVAPYLEAYRHFLADKSPRFHSRERFVVNAALGYCGTLDRMGHIDNMEGVLDIKCGDESEWHPLQLSGYSGCFLLPLARWNLYLRADGTYRFLTRRNRQDWAVFKALLLVSQWRKANQ